MRFLSLLLCAGCLVAQDAAGVRINGRVLDPEGRPLARVVVSVSRQGTRSLGSVVTNSEGSYGLSGRIQGYATLRFEAAGRLSGGVPLLLKPGSAVGVDARLPLIPWEEPKGPIPLMGLLDNQALPPDAKLTRQNDGTWAWEIAAKDGTVLQAGAMVKGYTTHPGHTADEYKDGAGIAIYRARGGRIRFVLDPRKMGRPGEQPSVKVLDPAQDGLRQAMVKTGLIGDLWGSMAQSGAPTPLQVDLLLGLLESEAATAPEGLATVYLMTEVAVLGASQRPVPQALADRILADLGPENYLWESNEKAILAVLKATRDPKASYKRLVAADKTNRLLGNLGLSMAFN